MKIFDFQNIKKMIREKSCKDFSYSYQFFLLYSFMNRKNIIVQNTFSSIFVFLFKNILFNICNVE